MTIDELREKLGLPEGIRVKVRRHLPLGDLGDGVVDGTVGWDIYCYQDGFDGTTYGVGILICDDVLAKMTPETAEKMGQIAQSALARRIAEDGVRFSEIKES